MYIIIAVMYTILLHTCPWVIMLCASQTDLYNTLNSNKSSPSTRNQAAIQPNIIVYLKHNNNKVVIAALNNS